MRLSSILFIRSDYGMGFDLQGKTSEVVQYITYLCIDPDSTYRDHWVSEIHDAICVIGMLNDTNNFPTKESIYKQSYDVFRDMYTNETFMTKFIKSVIKEETFDVVLSNFEVTDMIYMIDSACVDYFTWLSDELSKTGFVDIDEVQEKLDSLIPKST